MEKKVLAGLLMVGLFVLAWVNFSSAEDYTSQISNATECLKDQVRGASFLTLEEAIFSALAGVPDNEVEDTINAKKSSSENCWGDDSTCTVLRTAQAGLAKKYLGKNTDAIANWLRSRNGTVDELTWYLQITIDNNEPAECIVRHGSADNTVNINEDMTLSASGLGSCLSISSSGYWLKIADSCVNEEFITMCEANVTGFKTNLLYKKGTGGTVFVSPDTQVVTTSGGQTTEKITALCFVDGGGNCDYEGSLWATTFLNAIGQGTGEFVPYLIALAPENGRYFPSTFLLDILGSGENSEYYNGIVNNPSNKHTAGYWKVTNTAYNEYYDTGLAMAALGGADDVGESTLSWLFSVQTNEGCWNSNDIRDTAFIIYAGGWRIGGGGTGPGLDGNETICADANGVCKTSCDSNETTSASICSDEGEICCVPSGGGTEPATDCELAGHYCVDSDIDCLIADGTPLDYLCAIHTESCCTVDIQKDSCADLGGMLCGWDEVCSDATVQASDGACCLTECEETTTPPPTGCTSDNDCDSGKKCQNGACVTVEPEEEGNMWIWIIILIILIGFVVLGIIYRDKLRVWWFKMRGKAKISKIPPRGPPGVGAPIIRRPAPRFVSRGPPRRIIPAKATAPIKKAASAVDKEMEETMKKLKEMSK